MNTLLLNKTNDLLKEISNEEIEYYLMDLASRFPKNTQNYYLSYSGGRDSHFLLWFIKEYLKDNKIEIVSINTYMEHHEILNRMRKYADRILIPKTKPFEIKEKYGSPCFSKTQDEIIDRFQKGTRTKTTLQRIYGTKKSCFNLNKKAKKYVLYGNAHRISPKCCTYLKKQTVKDYEKETGKHAILAVRGSESFMRRSQYKSCFSKNGKFHPLYDLTDDMLHAIEKKYNIEVPQIYEYVTRTGCAGCPYGSWKHDTEKELRLVTKNQRKFLGEYFKESYRILGIDIRKIKEDCGDFN